MSEGRPEAIAFEKWLARRRDDPSLPSAAAFEYVLDWLEGEVNALDCAAHARICGELRHMYEWLINQLPR